MDLSVVIASTRIEKTIACLKGFAQQNTQFDFEVIVAGEVDGIHSYGSMNFVPISLQETHPNIKRNRAITRAKSNRIAFIDDDAIPCIDWVNVAVEFLGSRNDLVLTGPELCYPNTTPFSRICHQILSSRFSEFNKGHVNQIAEDVNWYEVPFCNCVFHKNLWVQNSGLSETIPWHMDDFHFFFSHKEKVQFQNIPLLKIVHDRYPESLPQLIHYKWRLRKETGEKLIWYSDIYGSIPSLKGILMVSFVLFTSAIVLALTCLPLLFCSISIYFATLLVLTIFTVSPKGIKNLITGFVVFTVVHVVSIVALYTGVFSALYLSLFDKRKY